MIPVALGLDLGTRRIGVAFTAGSLAMPYDVILRSGDRRIDHRRVAELVEEVGAGVVVVGLPLHLDGRISPAAKSALEEAADLGDTLPVPVETYDERLTTVTADRWLSERNLSAAQRRKVVDQVAAAVMLQAWLDHRLAVPPPPPAPDPSDPT